MDRSVEESLELCIKGLESMNFLDPNPWIPARTCAMVISELNVALTKLRESGE